MQMPSLRSSCLKVLFALLVLSAIPSELWADGPFRYHSLTPCRLIDTRDGTGQSTSDNTPGPRTSPGPYDITVKGFCGVPADATAVTLNITVVGPTQAGDLRIAPPPPPAFPTVSTLNYVAGEPALANGAIVPLKAGAGNDLRLVFAMVTTGTLHILVDVTGFFKVP